MPICNRHTNLRWRLPFFRSYPLDLTYLPCPQVPHTDASGHHVHQAGEYLGMQVNVPRLLAKFKSDGFSDYGLLEVLLDF